MILYLHNYKIIIIHDIVYWVGEIDKTKVKKSAVFAAAVATFYLIGLLV